MPSSPARRDIWSRHRQPTASTESLVVHLAATCRNSEELVKRFSAERLRTRSGTRPCERPGEAAGERWTHVSEGVRSANDAAHADCKHRSRHFPWQ